MPKAAHDMDSISPSRIQLPASPRSSPLSRPRRKDRPPPLDLSLARPDFRYCIVPPARSGPTRSSSLASNTVNNANKSLNYSNHHRQRRSAPGQLLRRDSARLLDTSASSDSASSAKATGLDGHSEGIEYLTRFDKEEDLSEHAPLLHGSLASASPIYDESNESSPLITPRQSFRLRPRERTSGADSTLLDDCSPTNPRAPEPIAEGTLVQPSWFSRLQHSWRHLLRDLVWRVECWFDERVEQLVQYMMHHYSLADLGLLTGQENTVDGVTEDTELHDDLLFPIGSMASDYTHIEEELDSVVIGDDEARS